jgi:uncharacterized low-complexity protein
VGAREPNKQNRWQRIESESEGKCGKKYKAKRTQRTNNGRVGNGECRYLKTKNPQEEKIDLL